MCDPMDIILFLCNNIRCLIPICRPTHVGRSIRQRLLCTLNSQHLINADTLCNIRNCQFITQIPY